VCLPSCQEVSLKHLCDLFLYFIFFAYFTFFLIFLSYFSHFGVNGDHRVAIFHLLQQFYLSFFFFFFYTEGKHNTSTSSRVKYSSRNSPLAISSSIPSSFCSCWCWVPRVLLFVLCSFFFFLMLFFVLFVYFLYAPTLFIIKLS
jgi:hypothetical protein